MATNVILKPGAQEEAFKKAAKQMADQEAALKKSLAQKSPRWYELDFLTPYRDLFLLSGFLIIVAGVGLWTIPGAMIAAGAGLIVLSWMMSR